MSSSRWALRAGTGCKCKYRVGGLLLCLTVLAGIVLPRPVHGHAGGEPVISEAPAGPFVLYVWLDPVPAVVGEQHVTVSVNAPVPGQADETVPVREAEVRVLATRAGDPDVTVSARATHAQAANKLFYEARLELPQPGAWQLSVTIAAGTETAAIALPLEVEEAGTEPAGTFLQRFAGWLRGLFART